MADPHGLRPHIQLVTLAVAALLASCGSTVQLPADGALGGSSVNGLTSGLSGGDAAGASTGASTGIPSVGATSGTTGAKSFGSAATGGSGTRPSTFTSTSGAVAPNGGTFPGTGPGWDTKTVHIGVVTEKDTQQAYAAAGARGIDPGDTEGQARAMANELNAHGGVLGRQVVLHFYDVKTVQTQHNPDSVGQAACTFFTQDHRVVAVWNVNTQIEQGGGVLRTCLAKRSVLLFTTAVRAISDAQMRSLAPTYVHTVMVSWDALAPVLTQRLKGQGWLGGWNTTVGQAGSSPTKIGILTDSTVEGKHSVEVLTRAFAALGYPGAVSFQYGDASQGQSASVQYFHGNGVTHLVITDAESTAFQIAAQSQNYYPRYGLTSYNAPYENLEASGLAPARANRGSMGVGWVPNLDVSEINDPGRTAGGRSCLDVMKRGGQPMSGKRFASIFAFSACDSFTLITRGARVGGGLSAQAIYSGLLRLGGSFSPANGFASALKPGQPYVQGLVRDLAWNDACSCMRYGAGTTRL